MSQKDIRLDSITLKLNLTENVALRTQHIKSREATNIVIIFIFDRSNTLIDATIFKQVKDVFTLLWSLVIRAVEQYEIRMAVSMEGALNDWPRKMT